MELWGTMEFYGKISSTEIGEKLALLTKKKPITSVEKNW